MLVADAFGNWDVRQRQFTTLRRVFQVRFPKITVLNDGDPFSDGEGEFWFRVSSGPQFNPQVIEEFHQSTMDIDDWSENGRPYAMGFAHMGKLTVVTPETAEISVSSWGVEHDGFLESDEAAQSSDRQLPFPVGPFIENANGTFTMDCPVASDGDDFHYKADVEWSVTYAP